MPSLSAIQRIENYIFRAILILMISENSRKFRDYQMMKNRKKQYFYAIAVMLFVGNFVFSAERVVLVEDFTNAYCSNCPLVGEIVDGYLEEYLGQVAVLRFHTSYNQSDPFYFPELCDWASGAYEVTGIPQLFLDGENLSLNDYPWDGEIENYLDQPAPVELRISGNFDGQVDTIFVDYEIKNSLQDGSYKIFLYLTEDNLEYEGSNGETIHNQVARAVFPNTDGIEIENFDIGVTDEIAIPFEIADNMILENCNLIAVFQDRVSKSVKNSAQIRVSELSAPNGIENNVSITNYELVNAYPNPFNPSTVISYFVETRCAVTLEIYDLHGKLIETLVDDFQNSGKYEIIWDAENLPSGVYFASLKSAQKKSILKILYLK